MWEVINMEDLDGSLTKEWSYVLDQNNFQSYNFSELKNTKIRIFISKVINTFYVKLPKRDLF